MNLSRQEDALTKGRSNQKMRTRQALVDAAVALVREGKPVTIADAAEVAQVSTATAYRYFSKPQDLLLETRTTTRTMEMVADLPDDPAERLDTLVARTAELQFGDEALWRALLRATQDRWFDQTHAQGEPDAEQVPIRGRTRLALTRTALAPLADTLSPELHRRLTMTVTLVYGIEALVAARDACGLEPDEAKDVMRWAAGALLQRALRES